MNHSEHHIYCISGLGADFRIFQHLEIEHAVLHPIKWEIPNAGEDLPAYALRLSKQIVHPNAIILGVSFGGMLATEISRVLPAHVTIIVSSCKSRRELPILLKGIGRIGLHKIAPYWLTTRVSFLNRLIFDTRSKSEEIYLKRIMLQHTNLTFLRRAVDMILHWKAPPPSHKIYHIHGRKDRLLSPGSIEPDYWIEDGGHFMVWNKAKEISKIINGVILETMNKVH